MVAIRALISLRAVSEAKNPLNPGQSAIEPDSGAVGVTSPIDSY